MKTQMKQYVKELAERAREDRTSAELMNERAATLDEIAAELDKLVEADQPGDLIERPSLNAFKGANLSAEERKGQAKQLGERMLQALEKHDMRLALEKRDLADQVSDENHAATDEAGYDWADAYQVVGRSDHGIDITRHAGPSDENGERPWIFRMEIGTVSRAEVKQKRAYPMLSEQTKREMFADLARHFIGKMGYLANIRKETI